MDYKKIADTATLLQAKREATVEIYRFIGRTPALEEETRSQLYSHVQLIENEAEKLEDKLKKLIA